MESEKLPKIPSNEEVIDELTKDFEKSYLSEENAAKDEKYFNLDDTEKENFTSDKIEEIKNDLEEDSYFIDEIALKDRDVSLTEEQIQEFKNESEKFKTKGNDSFRNGDYTEATNSYTEGIRICPLVFEKERAILFANRAAAKAKFMSEKTSAITDCTKAIELDPSYVKAFLRRAHLYEETDKLDEALADYEEILKHDSTHTESIHTITKLKHKIDERNEKLKTEMLGKLKDLGNMILKPFGLSTNNFKMEKDEATGGYSVKFNQNQT